MRRLIIIGIVGILVSCGKDDEPVYPFEQSPYVEFDQLVFHDSDTQDTLELSFIVWDEEGDIGLTNESEDLSHPYHLYDAIIDEDDVPVTITGIFNTPFYKVPTFPLIIDGETAYVYFPDQRTLFSEIDNRPPYSCDSYEILEAELSSDTFYLERNKFFYNLHVDFVNNSGESLDFNEIFNTQQCDLGNFNARLIPLGESTSGRVFTVERLNKFSWRVRYWMLSTGWKLVFLDNQFEVQFEVNDRELNESNAASSGLVTINEITEQ